MWESMKLLKRTLSTLITLIKNVATTTVFLKDNVKGLTFAFVNLKIQKLIVCYRILDENAVLKNIR